MIIQNVLLILLLSGGFVLAHDEEIDVDQVKSDLDTALTRAKDKANQVELTDKDKRQQGKDTLTRETPEELLDLFAAPDGNINVKRLAKAASIQLDALKELESMEHVDTFRLKASKKFIRLWKAKFDKQCPTTYTGLACDPKEYYRRIDGSCNNFKDPTWGAVFCPQARLIPPMYDDGIDTPRVRDRLGLPLKSARVISNEVHSVDGKSPRNQRLTMMVMQWGQFIDHEFVSTPGLKGEDGSNIECCGEGNEDRPQCFPIQIPSDDPVYNISCMGFVRSAPVPNHDCQPGYREQMNQVTSFIDGSAVYGSTEETTNKLRSGTGGLLKTVADGNTLPKNSDDKCILETKGDYCQFAGDFRVNVVPSLGQSHTAFMREHNRLAKQLSELNPHWDDETIFQEARRIMAAILQIINYGEYLPAILNKDTMKKYQLGLKKDGYNKIYRKNMNPSITNAFAVAAFRFGHSQIANYQMLMSRGYQEVKRFPIEQVYHRPHVLIENSGESLDFVTRWLIDDPTPLADGLFEDGVRNKLFLDKKKGHGLDLPALNIQRGRDHGIPPYNHWRVYCNLEKGVMDTDGGFILPDHDNDTTHKLEHVYRHADDIDLFTGAMTENLLPDSSVGPTFACLLGEQFRRLIKGDRFWHETSDKLLRFTKEQLAELRKITLARVLCDNFEIDTIQPNVFLVPGPNNKRVKCKDIPEIDLTKWASCPKPVYSSTCGK
ncbi:hypothetical protein ACF0H5_018703 [Mactra antiquata]